MLKYDYLKINSYYGLISKHEIVGPVCTSKTVWLPLYSGYLYAAYKPEDSQEVDRFSIKYYLYMIKIYSRGSLFLSIFQGQTFLLTTSTLMIFHKEGYYIFINIIRIKICISDLHLQRYQVWHGARSVWYWDFSSLYEKYLPGLVSC